MFIEELVKEIITNDSRGIFIDDTIHDLSILLLADDVAIFATSVVLLQKKIEVLGEYCLKWGLSIYVSKTKVVVFKNRGKIARTEEWTINGNAKTVISCNKYLGIIFSCRHILKKACETLALQAKKLLHVVKRVIRKYKDLPLDSVFELFDWKIQPILLKWFGALEYELSLFYRRSSYYILQDLVYAGFEESYVGKM